MILVTGATGQLGTAVIDQLLTSLPTNQFTALARSESKAEALLQKGVSVRIGDLDEVSSLEKAFDGVEKLLLISTVSQERAAQQKAVIQAAQRVGIKHIVYTGVAINDVRTAATRFIMESHFQTEDAIRESGLTYTFLRNSLYADVIPMYVGNDVFETGIYFPAGDGKSPYALRREMGEAAANVLVQSGHENKVYDITGSELYSFTDVAIALSDLSGKPVTYQDADKEEYFEKLEQSDRPAFVKSILPAFAQDIKDHQYAIVTEDLSNLLGRQPTALKEALKEVYGL